MLKLPAVGQKKTRAESAQESKKEIHLPNPSVFEASCGSSGWWFQPNISYLKNMRKSNMGFYFPKK